MQPIRTNARVERQIQTLTNLTCEREHKDETLLGHLVYLKNAPRRQSRHGDGPLIRLNPMQNKALLSTCKHDLQLMRCLMKPPADDMDIFVVERDGGVALPTV